MMMTVKGSHVADGHAVVMVVLEWFILGPSHILMIACFLSAAASPEVTAPS